MRIITCKNCGKKVVVKGLYEKLYCNGQCGSAYRYRQRAAQRMEPEKKCPMNEGITCGGGDCFRCGWNPEVEKARKEKLR